MILFENCKDIATGPLKSKDETKEKVLNKSLSFS